LYGQNAVKTDIIPATHPSAILHAMDVLNRCGLVAFPTDTVYGLAALAFSQECIERLYVVKGRNHTRAIAILLSQVDQLGQIAINLTSEARKLAEKFWPGPLTLVLTRNPSVPAILSPEPTIGVRIPDHPDALRLMNHTGPLAVTSANLSGEPPANSAQEVLAQLNRRIHLVIDGGPSPGGVPSTVVDCTRPGFRVLRPGPITEEQLQAAIV
jgi:L-threonylcarbamoyladenylate synthase